MDNNEFEVGNPIQIIWVKYWPLCVKVTFKLKASGQLVEYCRTNMATHQKVCRKKLRIPPAIYERMRREVRQKLRQQ